MALPTDIACICIEPETGGVSGRVGAESRFASGCLLDHQLHVLFAVGIIRVAVVAPTASVIVRHRIDVWRRNGHAVDLIENSDQISQWMGERTNALLLGNAVVATADTISAICQNTTSTVMVRDAATSDDRHERVDMNHRWVGMAIVSAETLRAMGPLAEGWSFQSALLRHLVQNQTPRITMEIGPAAKMRSEVLVTHDDMARWQGRAVNALFLVNGAHHAPFRRWISGPVTAYLLPLLWRQGEGAKTAFFYAQSAALALAYILAYFGSPILAIFCVLIMVLVEQFRSQWTALVLPDSINFAEERAFWLAQFALPPLAVIWSGDGDVLTMAVIGLLFSLSVVIGAVTPPSQKAVIMSRAELGAAMIMLLIAGMGLSQAALIVSAITLAATFWNPIVSRLKAI